LVKAEVVRTEGSCDKEGFLRSLIGGKKRPCPFVNESVRIELKAGDLLWLDGPSGVGKTSIAKHLAGLQPLPFSDTHMTVTWPSSHPHLHNTPRNHSRIGLLFQNGVMIDSLTVFENLQLSAKVGNLPCGRKTINEQLRRVGLVPERDGQKKPGHLSGGMLRRACLAQVLAQRKSVIVLDEPFVGLDPEIAVEISRLISYLRRTYPVALIVISHQHDLVLGLHPSHIVSLKPKQSDDQATNHTDTSNGKFPRLPVGPSAPLPPLPPGSPATRATTADTLAVTNQQQHLHPQQQQQQHTQHSEMMTTAGTPLAMPEASLGSTEPSTPPVGGGQIDKGEAGGSTKASGRTWRSAINRWPRYEFAVRFLLKLVDYLLYSSPLIILAFFSAGFAICTLFADLLDRIDPIQMLYDVPTLAEIIPIIVAENKDLTDAIIIEVKRKVYALAVAFVFVVELAPLLTGLLLSGRMGGSYSGEVAMMQATHQNDLLKILNLDPRRWSLLPALLSSLIACPLLTWVGASIAVWAGGIVAMQSKYTFFDSQADYYDVAKRAIWEWGDPPMHWSVYPPLVCTYRAVVYGFIIIVVPEIIARWRRCLQPAQVSKVITLAVVLAGLAIIIFDWGFNALLLANSSGVFRGSNPSEFEQMAADFGAVR